MLRFEPGSAPSALLANNMREFNYIVPLAYNEDTEHPALYESASGTYILNLAAKIGHLDGLRTCIRVGMDPNSSYNDYYPMHSAAIHGKTTAVRLMASMGGEVDLLDIGRGYTPLLSAVYKGYDQTVRELIRLGADVNFTNVDKLSPLTLATLNGHHQIADILVRAGANITQTDRHGDFQLNIACWQGHLRTAETLLRHGANINAVSRSLQTPLMSATHNAQVKMVEFLLKQSANKNVRNKNGETAEAIARKFIRTCKNAARKQLFIQIEKLLATPNTQNQTITV